MVGVTYANNKLTDGAGAQLQRIYGIYSLSRLLNLPYIHSPLTELSYQGLIALENKSSSEYLVSDYNKIFNIPSDIELPSKYIIYDVNEINLRIRTFERLKQKAAKKRIFILAQIVNPYGITDTYPEAYRVVKDISPFPFKRSEVFRVAIHVRRGELFLLDKYRNRMLPNNYYISVAQGLDNILQELKLNYVFELYTEVPSKIFTATPTNYSLISDEITVDPEWNKIEEFDLIPNLQKFINSNPIDTLERMATANVLIMSHSSFSYVAALLNKKGLILYNKFWSSPLKNWLTVKDSGNFSKRECLARLKDTGVT